MDGSKSKIEFVESNLLGIQPEPPEWPERNEIDNVKTELNASFLVFSRTPTLMVYVMLLLANFTARSF
ncbi:hypothetical protein DKX38_012456 [Salix brachista]|uniref:Uncharacterized protein n=1 Tax=Salix brachista TaxID=2182728 RepID=A0A5N5LNH0_9ROSI|nr:hypothetical protein DKX38_012456 [Salix brachista]